VPLTAGDWAIAIGLALCLLVVEEVVKLIRRHRHGVVPSPRVEDAATRR